MKSTGFRLGLTLLETLIATAILAMIAVACVPMMARATVLLRHRDRPTTLAADLSIVADAFVNDPEPFGVEARLLPDLTLVHIGWPSGPDRAGSTPRSSIDVRAIRSADSEVKHMWLVFECEAVSAWRWLAIPEREGDKQEASSNEPSR